MSIDENPLRLGRIVGTKRALAIGEEQRKQTHLHVIGASGTGKSKFLEYLIRQDIAEGRGVCLIDPHGELASNLLAWVSRLPIPPKRFYHIAPHRDDWTVCYNPLFKKIRDSDDWFLINAMKLAVVKVWGADDTLQTPRLDEWLKNVFYTAIALDLTLPEAAMLLEPTVERNMQRLAVAAALPDTAPPGIRAAWLELSQLAEKRKTVDFEARVGSTARRLSAFLDNPRLSRIFGVPDVSLDLARCMDEGAVMLVDLSTKGRFHPDDARLFGTLLLTDFYVQMFNRQKPKWPFSLYIDEFQNFATKDLARMLDESRKFGLQLVLAHQRPGQLQNSDSAEDRDIYSAVMTNARTKVVFGGISPDELEPVARLLSLGVLDPNQIKRELCSTRVVGYVKEYWEAHSHSVGHSHSSAHGNSLARGLAAGSGTAAARGVTFDPEGSLFGGPQALFTTASESWQSHFGESEFSSESWVEGDTESETDSSTSFPVLVPQLGQELSSVYYQTLDEQLYQFMAILYDQEQRHAMTRIIGQKEPLPIVTPFVRPAIATQAQIDRQLKLAYHSDTCFLPVERADQLVQERRRKFLALGTPDIRSQPTAAASPSITINPIPSMPEMNEPTIKTVKVGNIELQPRDLALLADVFESRFITIHHAALLQFADLKAAEAAAKRRLGKMAEAGLLRRQEGRLGSVLVLTETGFRAKEVKTVYLFTKKAFDVLIEHGILRRIAGDDWDGKLRKRFEGIAESTIAHEVGMLDIKAALYRAICQQAHLRLVEFGIWPLAYEFPVQRDGKFMTQQPDGFLHVAEFQPNDDNPRSHYFYIEFDRGTEPLDQIANKVHAYRQHLRTGGFLKWLRRPDARVDDYPFRVLFVIDTKDAAKRRDNICRRISELGIETLTQFTTLPELIKDPLGAIWLSPKSYKASLQAGAVPTPVSIFE